MKRKISDYWNVGTSIGFCAAIGILIGALLNNLILWLCIGAGIGVVIGALSQLNKHNKA
ncbi:MAG: hypothetical protein BWY11_02192 [Firmicutes bacterium ADurb.Bin182]|nr:MAG: hypothetical protein BWY11_02192 [Firmicutes bacterium ADurb.Bin182]